MPKTETFTRRHNKTLDETDLHPKFHGDQDLPPITEDLPPKARRIYREAFNAAQEKFSVSFYCDIRVKNLSFETGAIKI